MSKYCPICLSEFNDAIKKCPDDNVNLVDKKPDEYDEFVDVYAASDEIEAERIITFLHESGIDANESMTGISQVPSAGDTHFVICVAKEQAKGAKAILERAREDGVISLNGIFL